MQFLKREQQNAPYELEPHTNDQPESPKPKPPGHRYANYDHPTEHEHRTAEQFNWRNTKRLNVFIAIAAGLAAIFAFGSFYETRRQAVAAEKSLIASSRAWIKITSITVAAPGLRIDKSGALISLNVVAQNIGNIPAINGVWKSWIIPGPGGVPLAEFDPEKAQTERCGKIKRTPAGQGGFTIYPNDNFPRRGIITIGAGATNNEIIHTFHRGQPIPEAFTINVVGCFDYTFPTDPEKHHQTGFVLFLSRKIYVTAITPPLPAPPFDFDLNMSAIPLDNLELSGDLTGQSD